MNEWYQLDTQGNTVRLTPRGVWRLSELPQIFAAATLPPSNGEAPEQQPPSRQAIIDGQHLEALDTSGAFFLVSLIKNSGGDTSHIRAERLRPEHSSILNLVLEQCRFCPAVTRQPRLSLVENIGAGAITFYQHCKDFLAFVGETCHEFLWITLRPASLRVKELFVQLENVCLHAIPICGMVTFLIGVVVAYLFAGQIEKYGANIFIVDGVAISMCREMSPIIVAIIMAGRSGSAFTAQIGTMKLNEEIDAIVTLGLSPMRVLVFPRLLALVLAMPLLVFVGDIIGIIGGAIIADLKLGITYYTFYERLHAVLTVKSFLVGLVKAPVFAAFIAVIGCRMGLAVENNARSVGLNTTSTVVQSVVSVILLNAVFAVIFVELGI